jgi:hypothetical protein
LLGSFGNVTESRVAAVILDLLFVLSHLLFHLVKSGIKNADDVVPRFARHKIMTMFGIHKDFDIDPIVGKVHRDVDGRHSVEKSQKLFSLTCDVVIGTGTQSTVSAGDGNLHRNLLFLWNVNSNQSLATINKEKGVLRNAFSIA